MLQLPEPTLKERGSHILIDLDHRQLFFYEGNRLFGRYPVGVGKHSTPTPTGNFYVIEKIINPGGVLGSRWLGLSIPGGRYGIHGTNNPASIGGYVSNGCIRMHNRDIEEIFPRVEIGTPVEIYSAGGHPPQDGQPKTSTGSTVHIVKPGESLWQIAQMYGKDLETVIKANNLANPDLIYPGQAIIIP